MKDKEALSSAITSISCKFQEIDLVSVSNYNYEVALNEEKRSIDLLRNEYLGFFEDEFQSLI